MSKDTEFLKGLDEALAKVDDTMVNIEKSFGSLDSKIKEIDVKHIDEFPIKQDSVKEPEAPQISHVEVVLRDNLPAKDQECRPSEKHDGLEFCFVGDVVRSYRYDPNTFTRATGADLEKLQEKINECPLCKIDPDHVSKH